MRMDRQKKRLVTRKTEVLIGKALGKPGRK
jgi:hypothetical protein